MKFSEGQQAALTGVLDAIQNRPGSTLLLQGPAGTGKTAVLGQILQWFIANHPGATNPNFDQWGRQLPGKLCVAAMSHKAKGEVSRSLANYGITDHPCITCDALLKARVVVDPNTRAKATMRQQVNLDSAYEFIVIDEVSMMSQQYFDWLMEWKMPYQTILFLGDKAQLPPVSDGKLCSVFKDCDETFNLTEVMRHDGAILNACNKIRRYGVGYPKLETHFDDADKGVIVMDDKEQFLKLLYSTVQGNPDLKVVCHTNKNVHMVNDAVHKLRNPGCSLPFVPGEHIMSARAIQVPGLSRVLCPSSMDMKVLECEANQVDLGMAEAEKHLLGMGAVRAVLGSDGDEDLYRCHIVGAEYDGGGIIFRVFNNHKGEEKRFNMTQEFLKGYADDRSRDTHIRQALNRYINWREEHFASVHLSTAMTIHKSQGSSFEEVWVFPDIPNRNDKQSNALAYVAASRAKRRLIVCN